MSIDGGPTSAYNSGDEIPVTGDGRHVVTYTVADGRTGTVSVPIDHHDPTIGAVVTPAANADNWRKAPATVQFICTDTDRGSCRARRRRR